MVWARAKSMVRWQESLIVLCNGGPNLKQRRTIPVIHYMKNIAWVDMIETDLDSWSIVLWKENFDWLNYVTGLCKNQSVALFVICCFCVLLLNTIPEPYEIVIFKIVIIISKLAETLIRSNRYDLSCCYQIFVTLFSRII